MYELMTSCDVIPYRTNKEKCAAVRVFREEYKSGKIKIKDGLVMCEYRQPIVDGSVMIM